MLSCFARRTSFQLCSSIGISSSSSSCRRVYDAAISRLHLPNSLQGLWVSRNAIPRFLSLGGLMSNRLKLAAAVALLAGLPVLAVSTKFSEFTPLTSSATALPVDDPGEATPIALSHAKWSQRTVADRRTQNILASNSNDGSWDMIT